MTQNRRMPVLVRPGGSPRGQVVLGRGWPSWVAEAERLTMPVPELAHGCVRPGETGGWYLVEREVGPMSHLLLAVGLVLGVLVVLVLVADLMVEESARLSREPRDAEGDQDRS
jgi:hypothetical protein